MLKSVFRRIRKGIRDIGSFAQDNPLLTAGAAAFGPSLFGMGSPLIDLFKTGIGTLGKKGVYDTALGKMVGGTDPSGILGIGKDILGSLTGKEKLGGIMGLINTYLAKKQFDQEKADELRREKELKDRYSLVSRKFGTDENPQYTGGTPFLDQVGIAQLKMGGTGGLGAMPFNPNNKISGIIPARATGGIMDEMVSEEIFDPRMSGNQMMNQIKKNPGITEFFPPKFGMIEGPGGPKDDKIPAMLSDGEFVMTAKAVDKAGGPKAMYGLMNALDPESSKGKGIV